MTSYLLQHHKIKIIHETIIATFFGIICGLVIHFAASGGTLEKLVAFDHRYFFNLLRPPIVLRQGYDLDVQRAYQNIGPISLLGFVGSLMSMGIIGSLLYVIILLPFTGMSLTFLQCLIFGSILSSTDPLPFNALLREANTDPTFRTIIFSESVFNGVMSIFMFHILMGFEEGRGVSSKTIVGGIGYFFMAFFSSMMLGVAIGFGVALLLKNTELHRKPMMESCVVILAAYISHLLSTVLELSGAISILFTGIMMKRYVYHNLSPRSKTTTTFLFQMLSYLAENFIFAYLGLSLFTRDFILSIGMTMTIFVLVIFTRGLTVFPLCWLANLMVSPRIRKQAESTSTAPGASMPIASPLLPTSPQAGTIRPKTTNTTSTFIGRSGKMKYITREYQILIWWSGLRGALAVALCMVVGTSKDMVEMRTATLLVVLMTILIFGGGGGRVIKMLNIAPALQETVTVASAGTDGHGNYGSASTSSGRPGTGISDDDDDDYLFNSDPEAALVRRKSQQTRPNWFDTRRWNLQNWFVRFDRDFLMPLFTRQLTEEEFLAQQKDEIEIATFTHNVRTGGHVMSNRPSRSVSPNTVLQRQIPTPIPQSAAPMDDPIRPVREGATVISALPSSSPPDLPVLDSSDVPISNNAFK